MWFRGSRGSADVLRGVVLRGMSDVARGASKTPELKIVRPAARQRRAWEPRGSGDARESSGTRDGEVAGEGGPGPKIGRKSWSRFQSPHAIRQHEVDETYVAWQRQEIPRLAGLGHAQLKGVLFEAEKRLPLLPEPEFMQAWLEAARREMTQMSVAAWLVAEKLGARPDKEYLREFGAAAGQVQTRRIDMIMNDLLDLQLKWGGTLETMKPFLEAWTQAEVLKMRKTDPHPRVDTAWMFRELEFTPSNEYVEEWARVAANHASELVQGVNGRGFWFLMNSLALMPTQDVTLVLPALRDFTRLTPRFDNVSVLRLVHTLLCFADVSHQPPEEWIEAVAAELTNRVGQMDRERLPTIIQAVAGVASPAKDSTAVQEFARAWAAASRTELPGWHANFLVTAFAALVRLGVGPGVIGREWFEAWLKAAQEQARLPLDPRSEQDVFSNQQLLRECHAIAKRIYAPIKWESHSLSASTKATRLVRDLRDLRALKLTDRALLRAWLDIAEQIGLFRRHQVQLVARYLRELGAEDMAQEWERTSVQRALENVPAQLLYREVCIGE